MFRRIGFLAIVLVLAVPFSAFAIQLTDYTFPDIFYQEAKVTTDINLKSGNQQQTSYDGDIGLNYVLQYDTLPQTFHFDTIGSKFHFEQDPQKNTDPNKDDSRESYDVFATTYFNKYYKDTSFYGYGNADFHYYKEKSDDDAKDPYFKVGVGIGYGRVIIATPLAKAIRMVEELKKYNVMNSEPSDACYLELARMIDKEPEFKSKYGLKDYEQYLYKELEDILNKEGLLKSGVLGVVGVLRLREVLIQESTMGSSRIQNGVSTWPTYKHGWKVQAGVGYIVSNDKEEGDEDPVLDALFEYALPITNRLQFIETFKYSTVLGNSIGHEFGNWMNLSYKLMDNIVWQNNWNITLTVPKDAEDRKVVKNDFASDFIYEITNTLSLDLLFGLKHSNEYDAKNKMEKDEIEKTVKLGFSYRLW